MTDELITLIARETGWSLEYIRDQPLTHLYALVAELQNQRGMEAYERAHNAALIVCALVSSRTRRFKPHDIIGEMPTRRDMSQKKLVKKPKVYTVMLGDGKEYKLPTLTLNVMADLEEEFDLGLEEISTMLQTRQASSLRRALYVLLHRGYSDITKDEVGELVDAKNLESVARAVAEALSGE